MDADAEQIEKLRQQMEQTIAKLPITDKIKVGMAKERLYQMLEMDPPIVTLALISIVGEIGVGLAEIQNDIGPKN